MTIAGLDTVRILLTATLLAAATITDLRAGKIYNKLTIPLMIIGLALSVILPFATAADQAQSVQRSLLGLVAPIVIFWIPFQLGWFGAGDVKLMAAVGALCGYVICVNAIIYSLAIGLFTSLIIMAWRGILVVKLREILTSLAIMKLSFGTIETADRKSVYSYGINFLLGVIVIVLLGDNYWLIHY